MMLKRLDLYWLYIWTFKFTNASFRPALPANALGRLSWPRDQLSVDKSSMCVVRACCVCMRVRRDIDKMTRAHWQRNEYERTDSVRLCRCDAHNIHTRTHTRAHMYMYMSNAARMCACMHVCASWIFCAAQHTTLERRWRATMVMIAWRQPAVCYFRKETR